MKQMPRLPALLQLARSEERGGEAGGAGGAGHLKWEASTQNEGRTRAIRGLERCAGRRPCAGCRVESARDLEPRVALRQGEMRNTVAMELHMKGKEREQTHGQEVTLIFERVDTAK